MIIIYMITMLRHFYNFNFISINSLTNEGFNKCFSYFYIFLIRRVIYPLSIINLFLNLYINNITMLI